jgi:Ca-activated chloride channel homolog
MKEQRRKNKEGLRISDFGPCLPAGRFRISDLFKTYNLKFKIISLLLLSSPSFAQTTTAPVIKTRILFMLDASGSMMNTWSTSNRFIISKKILSAMVDSLQRIPNVEIGLRVFGSNSALSLNDCKDTRLEAPIRPNNSTLIKSKLNTLQAKGITPIAYSMEQAANDFSYWNAQTRNIIVLISDGIESCEANTCEVSRRLQKKGIILQPFIIGLGMDEKASDFFDCVGRYEAAKDELGFRRSLKNVMNTILNNTTAQVSLLDENGKPTESNVNMTFYDNNSGIVRYHLMHTLNSRGNPDTLYLDPVSSYNLTIHTTPPVEKKNISIIPNQHNTIAVNASQGDLTLQVDGLSSYKELSCLIMKDGTSETIDIIELGQKKKYLTGTYDLEILTLPRLNVKNVRIKQNETTTVKIPAPGIVTILNTNSVPVNGSIYVEKGFEQEWVCDIKGNVTTETISLQPGNYRLVYKNRSAKKSMNTKEEKFKISSGSSANIRF